MKFLHCVTVFIMTWPWILAFVSCVATDQPEVLYNTVAPKLYTSTNGGLFGFSVSSVYSGPRAQLLVGAPLANNIGDIYKCKLEGINNDTRCTAVNRTIIDTSNKDKYLDESFWFGATVKGNDKFFVGCAPRFITLSQIFNDYVTNGQCYTYENEGQQNELVYLDATRRFYQENKTELEQTMDSFGWSLDIINGKDSIVTGSPVLTTGMVYKRDLSNLNYNIMQKKETNRTNIYFFSANAAVRYNFGYSVVSLLSKSNKNYIAVGSTFNKGSVTFLEESTSKHPPRERNNTFIYENLLRSKKSFTLQQSTTGSMFGATLCIAKLKGPALLVGAPASASNGDYNVGTVYVYITTASDIPQTLLKTIVGGMKQSFFGSAIASLGDLNGDSLDEIAIGAPFENDGQGAVYIFSGAKLTQPGDVTMAARDCQQKIGPSPTYKTLGYSLAALPDYDDNGCKELAIGIPESSAVMVVRCAAVITIHLVKFPVSFSKNSSLKLPVCISAQIPNKPRKIQADIDVQIKIQHDAASLRRGVKTGIESYLSIIIPINNSEEQHCGYIDMDLKNEGKYNKKIFYQLLATLIKDPMNDPNFEAAQVKLSGKSILKLTGGIWIQECGVTACKPKLTIVTEFSEKSPYKIGSSDTIDVTASVKNTGDVAYDTCVNVLVTGAQALATKECKLIESTDGVQLGVQCRPTQLLRNNGSSNFTVSVDTTPLTNLDEQIYINVTLFEPCDNSAAIKYTKIETLKTYQLYPDAASVEIHGRTDEGVSNVVGLTKSDISSRKSFEHIYMISNTGMTTWKNVGIYIQVQKKEFVTTAVMINSATCSITNENVTIASYTCDAPTLAKQTAVGVKVLMQVVPDQLSHRINKENVTVYSEIHVYLGSTTKSRRVTSELKLVEKMVPIWMIIVSCVLALVVFAIIVFILRECGCLKRKNKEDLKKAKMTVRRQTMMRLSKANHSSSDDHENLVIAELSSVIGVRAQKKKDRRIVVKDT